MLTLNCKIHLIADSHEERMRNEILFFLAISKLFSLNASLRTQFDLMKRKYTDSSDCINFKSSANIHEIFIIQVILTT